MFAHIFQQLGWHRSKRSAPSPPRVAWLSHYCPALPTKSKLLSNAASLLVSIHLLCFNSFSRNTKYLFFATGPDIDFVTEMLGFISIIYVAYKCVRACARVVVFMQSISGVRRKFPGGPKFCHNRVASQFNFMRSAEGTTILGVFTGKSKIQGEPRILAKNQLCFC